MAKFYEAQRKRMGILLDEEGRPSGGKWSYDEENRKKLPKKVAVPGIESGADNEFVGEALDYIKSLNLNTWGEETEFIFPISHQSAEQWLQKFLEQRFSDFGTYEDALSVRGPFLFHSVLTPMLNIGLLDPAEVVQSALDFGERKGVALNNVEGFVRQVIGWREYMKLMYQRHGVEMRNGNFWGFENEIPKGMYTGDTGILPVDLAVKNLHKHGYTHHIDRLMVLGNFCMLMRIKPDAVYQWFMDVFIDSYDWVMVPNVYGMSQFSDGGLLVTKPYISGSNYIRKMSDYPAGTWTEAWDSLFWTFVEDHREFFAKQYRMKMMLSHINKMGADKLSEHYKRAADVRETLMQGKAWGEPSLL
jgi:deoxyribodipyrimidine photolyase-related protein